MGCVLSQQNSSRALEISKIYKEGLPPLEYFHDRIFPRKRKFLDGLNLDENRSWEMFATFLEADADWSGSLSLAETTEYFSLYRTRFVERLFALFDKDGSGELDYLEFVAGLWNVCTMDNAAIARFCFELVGSGTGHDRSTRIIRGEQDDWEGITEPEPLTLPQCDALYRMLTEQPTEAVKPDDLTESGRPTSDRNATVVDKPAQQSKSTPQTNTIVPLGVEASTALGVRDNPATAGADDDVVSLVDTDSDSVLESQGSHRSRSRQGSIDSTTSAELKSWLWKRGQDSRAAITNGNGSIMQAAYPPASEGPASAGTSTSTRATATATATARFPSSSRQRNDFSYHGSKQHKKLAEEDDADWWSGAGALSSEQAALPGHAMLSQGMLQQLEQARIESTQPGKPSQARHAMAQSCSASGESLTQGPSRVQIQSQRSSIASSGPPTTPPGRDANPGVSNASGTNTTGQAIALSATGSHGKDATANKDSRGRPIAETKAGAGHGTDAASGERMNKSISTPQLAAPSQATRFSSSPAASSGVEDSDCDGVGPGLHPAVLAADTDDSGTIDFDEFIELLRTHPKLLGAATAIRSALRSRCLGRTTWLQLTRWRNERFPPGSSVDYIMDVHYREQVSAMNAYVQQRKEEEDALRAQVQRELAMGDRPSATERWLHMGPKQRRVEEEILVLNAVKAEVDEQYQLAMDEDEGLDTNPDALFGYLQLQSALRRMEVQLQECIRLIPASVEERRAKEERTLPRRAFEIAQQRYRDLTDVRARVDSKARSRLREYRALVHHGGTGYSAILKESLQATESQGLQAAARHQILQEYAAEVLSELESGQEAKWYGVMHAEIAERQVQLDGLLTALGVDESSIDKRMWKREWDASASQYVYTCVARDVRGGLVALPGSTSRSDLPRRIVRGRRPKPGDERVAPVVGMEDRATDGPMVPYRSAGSLGAVAGELQPTSKAGMAAAQGWRFSLPGSIGFANSPGRTHETKEELDKVVDRYFGDASPLPSRGTAYHADDDQPESLRNRKKMAALTSLEDHKASKRIDKDIAAQRTVGALS